MSRSRPVPSDATSKPRALVITTINAPTETVVRTRELQPDWSLIVVGDTKTPSDWHHDGVQFLSLDDQRSMPFELGRALPVRHYARKNIGYLEAIRAGAEVIAETDDDNFPYPDFLDNVAVDCRARPVTTAGWVNVYRCFTDRDIWPRGFPLDEVRASLTGTVELGEPEVFHCPVQQYLADGDPDVDAVFRLVMRGDVNFARDLNVVLPPGTHCPFNSQNTVWFPTAYPLLYLPSTVSFRMTDIWRSFVAARCLAAMGHPIAFRGPTVHQDRNEHSLIGDFEGEIDGYLHNREIVDGLAALDLSGEPFDDMRRCYDHLIAESHVDKLELDLLDLWITDFVQAAS